MTRVALITGGGTGIGAATAVALADDGWTVYIVGRSLPPLVDTAQDRSRVTPIQADITRDSDRAVVVDTVTSNHPEGLDLLVNNAGISRFGGLGDLSNEAIDITIDTNLRAPILLTRAFIEALTAARGTVVNVSSAVSLGIRASPENAVYGACKAGLDVLTRSWAVELAPTVRVVGVAPGVTDTDIGIRSGMPEESYRAFLGDIQTRIPSERVAEPVDVASVIIALVQPPLGYINGAVIPVDGGLSVT